MNLIERKTQVLLALFVSSMVIVNTLGTKITTMFGIRVSVGILFVPLLFLITDIIGEVHGKKRAQFFVKVSSGILIFMFLMIIVCIKLPANAGWGNQEQYELIFGSSLRMTFASIVSFMISQYYDVIAFDFFKGITKGKHLWLRNNLSTMTSQLIDTSIFMFLAFYRISPKFTAGFILSLIIPYWLFKVTFALLDTPLCYIGVKWLRGDSLTENKTVTTESTAI